jgi:hypothetical protein
MAMALRPRRSASAISSRYGSHALALGARLGRGTVPESVDTSALVAGFAGSESVDTSPEMAGFDWPGSVDTVGGEIAGFALDSPGRPRQRLGRRQLIAGFEVSINCRFWVSTEVRP